MSGDLLELSAAGAAAEIAAGAVSADELFDFYRERAGADREAGEQGLGCFTWVAEESPEAPAGSPLGGVPLAVKDLFCTKDVPSQSGSRILEGYLPPYTATVVARLQQAGAPLLAKTNQDEFAMGSSTENSAYGPTLQPVGPHARARAGPRAAAPRRSPPAWPRGRSARTPAARSASRPRCAASSG